MPRYVDAEELQGNIQFECGLNVDGLLFVPFRDVIKSIQNAPTADVAPAVHAHWIFHKGVFANNGTKGCFECSGCKTTIDTETFDRMYECGQTRRCGACGAQMDEKA